MNSPLVSIVIPFYKNLNWLEDAVGSVLAQTYRNYEIIVINDGSIEDDSSFVGKYGDIVKYIKVENNGPGAARNKGISLSRGKYVAFLDSDDLWLPHKLEKQVAYMEQSKLIWSHTLYSAFNDLEGIESAELVANSYYAGDIFPKSLVSLQIGTPCVMVLMQYLRENPKVRFSEKMRYGQDGYMWILLSLDNKLGIVKEQLTFVRRTGSNAVLRARVHLKVKADLYWYLIRDLNVFIGRKVVGASVRIAYKYCYIINKLIGSLEKTGIFGRGFVEFVSKLVYLPAFLFFKIYIKIK